MVKKIVYGMPYIFLVACATPTEKYRDIKHLEMPPTLGIEHTSTSGSDSNNNGRYRSEGKSTTQNSGASDLENLILLAGSETKPKLELKTRFDRAWDLVNNALRLTKIEVVEKNKDNGVFHVQYLASEQGKGEKKGSTIFSFFTDKFENAHYTITVDKDKKITDVRVDKDINPEHDADEQDGLDESASLVKLLHKTILEDLQK